MAGKEENEDEGEEIANKKYMGMIQIVTASSEVNASIIKGFLEGAGIKSNYGPSGNISMLASGGGSMGSNQPQNIFVPEEKSYREAFLSHRISSK